jgi:hypothetical protein
MFWVREKPAAPFRAFFQVNSIQPRELLGCRLGPTFTLSWVLFGFHLGSRLAFLGAEYYPKRGPKWNPNETQMKPKWNPNDVTAFGSRLGLVWVRAQMQPK